LRELRSWRCGGALACNVIGTLAVHDFVATFVAALRRVFEDVRILPVVDIDEQLSRKSRRNVVAT
jgi:hypothetical protein